MAPRRNTPVRFSEEGLAAAQRVADEEFDGNRSQAIRRLLALGLAAWDAGHRTPQTIRSPK